MNLPAAPPLLLFWLINYLIHSTLLLGGVWLLLRLCPPRSLRLRERLWTFAACGGLASATLSLVPGFRPLLTLPGAPLAGAPVALLQRSPETGAPEGLPRQPLLAWRRQDPRTTAHPAPAARTSWTPRRSAEGASAPSPDRAGTRSEPAAQRGGGERFTATHATPLAASGAATGPTRTTSPTVGQLLRRVRANLERAARAAPAPLAAASALLLALGLAATALAITRARRRLGARLVGRRFLHAGPLFEELERLRRRAGVSFPVRLSIAPRLAVPLSFGFARREIALPPRCLADLSVEQRLAVLAHELAHCVRRDPLRFTLLAALQRILFVQPLNRLARRELADLAELACDDQAVRWTGRSLPLASSLAEVARWMVEAPPPLTTAAMASPRSRLSQRVERLLDDRVAPVPERRHSWFAPTALALVPGVALGLPGLSAAERSDPDPRERATSAPPSASTDAAPAWIAAALPAAAPAASHGVLPTRPELPAPPAVAPRQQSATRLPDPSSAPVGLRLGYELFQAELQATGDELAELEDDLAGSSLEGSFAEPLGRIEARLRRLEARARQVGELLPPLPSSVDGGE